MNLDKEQASAKLRELNLLGQGRVMDQFLREFIFGLSNPDVQSGGDINSVWNRVEKNTFEGALQEVSRHLNTNFEVIVGAVTGNTTLAAEAVKLREAAEK